MTKHILWLMTAVWLLLSCAGAGERARMAVLLEKAEQMDLEYIPLDTVTFMEEVLDFYMSHGNEDERIRANYMMGGVYRDRGDSPMALEYYLKAVNQADTTDQNCNFKKIGRIYGQMAELFQKQRFPQKSIEMWEKGIEYAVKSNDTIAELAAIDYLSSSYYMLGDTLKALQTAKKAYEKSLLYGNKKRAASALTVLINYYLESDSLDKTKEAFDEYNSLCNHYDEKGEILDDYLMYHYYVGLYYEKCNKLDSALFYYNTLKRNKDLPFQENLYHGLMSIYGKLNIPDSAIKYSNLYAEASFKRNLRNSASEISRANMLYNYSEHQKLAVQKTLENNRLKYLFIIAIVALFSLAIIIYFHNKSEKNKRATLNLKYSTTLKQYLAATKELNDFKENKELFEETKQKEIDDLRKSLSAYQTNANFEQWSLEQDLLQHPIVQALHNYATRIATPAESEWKDLVGLTEKILPEFYSRITDPTYQISEKEFYICILTRLHFLPSEIAALMNFSKQRVSNLRGSANKKLFENQRSKGFDWNIHNI